VFTASPHRVRRIAIESLPRTIPVGVFSMVLVLFHRHYGLRFSVAALPISVMGIAIAFYVGFKNSQAYDRFWEARKIWGAIVNTSRSWAIGTLDLVQLPEGRPLNEAPTLGEIHKELVYRHLAWVHALRLALRGEDGFAKAVGGFLSKDELNDLQASDKPTLALLRRQSQRVEELAASGYLRGFVGHQDLRFSLRDMIAQQGQCERIRNTPLVPHYTVIATLFVRVFVFLVPFALIESLADPTEWAVVPVAVIIGWMFDTMDRVGRNTEDPFTGTATDVPMTALSTAIERDLRALLGESELPKLREPVEGVLD
jgi:ion channel-forming bestrophin family protein